ncbi:MAG: primosomal protein N' [Spirochaetales bacterium]
MIAEVIVDVANAQVDKVFDYKIENNLDVKIGSRVIVPFGARRIEGYIVAIKKESVLPNSKLKSIVSLCEKYPVINSELLELSHFMKHKYNLKMVDILRLFLPSSMRAGTVKPVIKQMVKIGDKIDTEVLLSGIRKNAKNQIDLVEFLLKNKEADRTELNKNFGSVTVNKFIENGVLETSEYEVKRTPYSAVKTLNDDKVTLTSSQKQIVEEIMHNPANTYLLHGVTGSGKTEVYMRVISQALNDSKTAIMLVPEISLTPQVLKNFRARFGSQVAILHSGLSAGERYDEWRRIKDGEAQIVVGARSAIFAPINNIGVIVIDEEHDGSYFSESNPRYHTHEIAEFRAKFNNCPLILGSATPSIESFYKAENAEYKLLELKERINKKEMPEVEIVDMLSELRVGNSSMFSKSLQIELTRCIENKEQAMLFINRRGYSSFLRCMECGYVPKCTDCDVSLVYHKEDHQLKCHFCGKRYEVLTNCPNCGSDKLRQGAIGTQRVVSELKEKFPLVKVLRMDNDTVNSKNSHLKILSEFSNTRPSLLVGTQMIAKGHDFPFVTLVGIMDADLSLHFADYRANERTFQLITQVSGRAGRDELKGKIILQTYSPRHYVYSLAKNYDYKGFFDKELNLRKVTKFPPYAKIVRILATGEDEQKTKDFLHEFFDEIVALKNEYKDDFLYLDAMKSPVKRISNKYRYQILIRLRLQNEDEIIQKIYAIHNKLLSKSITCFVELDPQNLS